MEEKRSSVSRKRQAVDNDVTDLSSDDDFQPTLYNVKKHGLRKRRKLVTVTEEIPQPDRAARTRRPKTRETTGNGVSTRTRTKAQENVAETREDDVGSRVTKKRDTRSKGVGSRGRNSKTSVKKQATALDGTPQASVRVVLRRIDLDLPEVKPGGTYSVSAIQKAKRQKSTKKGNQTTLTGEPRKRHYKRSILSLPHVDRMHTYSSLANTTCHEETKNLHGKRNILDVIDSSDDESILIKGKPSRKKLRKEELSDSFLECFYASSSDESILNSESDEDIFASPGDESEAKEKRPDERQMRMMKRRTLQLYSLFSNR